MLGHKHKTSPKPLFRFIIPSIVCILSIAINTHATTNRAASGTTHALAVTTIDTVYCTGSNIYDECDVSGWTDITQVAAGSFFSIGLDYSGNVFCAGKINYQPCDVSAFSGSKIVYIAAGSTHAVGIDDSGKVIGVGSTSYDKLDIGSWSDIVQVACGQNHTVGLKNDDTVICVGNNYRGQCDVSSWTNISQISAGLHFTIGLQANSIIFTGWNNCSQGDFSGWPQGSITYITAGDEHTVAVDSSRDTWATGQNQDGQCEVSSLPDIVSVVAGPKNTIGIQENGEMFVTGSQTYGTEKLEGFQLINNYPEAVAGSISMYEDYSATTIDLLSLATDYESQPLTVVTSHPSAPIGSVVNHLDGTYTYYPDTHHNGSDSFTYTVTDSHTYNYTGTAIVSVSITPVNDPPDFSGGLDITLNEDNGQHTAISWVYGLTAGAYNESDQALSITWTCTNESLFLTKPTLTPSIADTTELTLTYAFGADENGVATLTVVLSDDGGLDYLAYGAQDTITRSYLLTSLPVNDVPALTATNYTILEDSTSHFYPTWASNYGPGAYNETSQTVSYTFTNDNTSIFYSQPFLDISGTTGSLSYTLITDMFGLSSLTVVVWDDGGTDRSGVDCLTQVFTINVLPVNDIPGFDVGPNCFVNEDTSGSYPSWATNITPGTFNETAQQLTFSVTTSCAACFDVEPIIDPATGDMSYTLSADGSGDITIWVQLSDDGGTPNGGFDTVTHSFSISVTDINDPPDFTLGPNILEDINGAPGWATNFTTGSAFETEQSLFLSITHTNTSLFTGQPALDIATGDLTYTLAASIFGSTTVTIVLSDDGGTALGGIDTITKTFVLKVLPVNDIPDFVIGPDRTILESHSETYTAWATGLTCGAYNETEQSFSFSVTTSCSDCFDVEPIIDAATGDLSYTLSADGSGPVTVWVSLTDSGGTSNGGIDTVTYPFSIGITDVNDPPGFILGINPEVEEDSADTLTGWATDITPANKFEIGQSLSFDLTNTNPSLFSTQPFIDSATGNLTYTLAANEFGSATITAVLSDDGGTANGGVDRITKTFLFTVLSVNDAPDFTVGPDHNMLEGAYTSTSWASGLTSGAYNETGQSFSFSVTTSCDACFAVLPVIYTSTGNLSYTLSADASGFITVWVSLTDSGGTDNNGVDTTTHPFNITITNINDPPNCSLGTSLTVVNEDSTSNSVSSWATDITPGNQYESAQSVFFSLTNNNPALFVDQPLIENGTGDLSYTLAANAFGSATVTVVVFDDGGTANGGIDRITKTFTITVLPVNDAPAFSIASSLTILEGQGKTYTSWAKGLTQGAFNETDQSLSFSIITSCPECFLSAPVIYTATGDLCYTLSADHNENITVWASLIDDGGTANGGVDRITHTFTINVLSVNDPPGVTIEAGQTVLEESVQTFSSWASGLTQGAFNETDQHLSYSITTSCSECFITEPIIYTASGNLTYTLAADFFGQITVWVVLMDDGGTANGGVDTITQSFSITVTNINDAPGFSQGSHLTVNEDSVCTSSGWASAITPGNSYETSQTVSFALTNTNPSLFSSQPQIDSQTGDLSYTLIANAFGSATVTVVLSDDGGTADGGVDRITQTFTLTVEPINDAPGFAIDFTSLTILEDQGATYTAWAKSLTQGAFNETDQSLSFSITTSCPECFSSEPVIYTATGDLCYTLAADHNENITVWATLIDSGGTANGGVDRITQTFLINVLSVNDPPGVTIAQNLEVLEDSAGTYTSWASALTQGAFNETDQQLSYSITTSCPECFITEPFIYTASGDLTYTLAADFFGKITVWVVLMDDGGTANSGVDTITQSFSITVTNINDPPGYTSGGNLTVDEDSVCTSSGWASGITPGNSYETSQTVSFSLTNTNPDLFSSQPQIDSQTGDLSYTLTANAFGSATVTVVLWDDGGTADGGVDRMTNTFTINVLSVNDPPGVTIGSGHTVLEESAQTYTSWATALTQGAFNETDQHLSYSITTSCPECFIAEPFIYTASGDLTYTLAADFFGKITVWVVLMDDGGTANGGVDTITQSFSITVTNINDPPGFSQGSHLTVNEDSVCTSSGWATEITPGNSYEMSQAVAFALTNTNPGLFSSQPQIDSQTGDLSYTLIANAFGSATVTVVLSDDGGTADGGVDRITQTFTLTVEPINDAPGFAIDSTSLTILEDQGATYTAWAKSLTQGAFNEIDQALSFSITTSCPECFISEPVIYTATGDLCYTLAADHHENITAWATLIDSGGTANGGVDRITQTFFINVLSVNDPPGFTIAQNLEVLEDSAGTYTSWATALTQGAFNETDQQLSYSITTSCPECFIAEPFIYTASGDLTYTLAADFFGNITVWVALMDDGGTANGGVDTVTHSFSITVVSINDPPGYTPGGNLTVDEDSVCTSSGWATGITSGNSYEMSQPLSFALTNTNPDLFSSQPQIDSQTGYLSYTLTANAFGSATVTVVLWDDGGTADGGVDRITNTFTITVLSVNDPPGFTIAQNLEVLEDSAGTYTSWASALTQGAFNETDQHLSYSITTSCPECFITEPIIYTASGNLTYTLAADFFGKITVWVVLMDDGGTANGGVDSITQSFSITVTNINDPPGYTSGGNLTVNEDSVCTSSGWATAITPGNSYETSQTVSFALTNTNPDLFSSQPQIDSQTGDLSYTLTSNAFGSATVTVVLWDDGGTADVGVDRITNTFTINVLSVNDPPGVTIGAGQTVLEESVQTFSSWASGLTQGAFNETDQHLSYSITTSCPECFITEPIIYTASGNLTYTLAADFFGQITVWVVLMDDGGTANGGVDTITQSFSITVTNINDAPGFSQGSHLTVNEDSVCTSSGWASGITPGNSYETSQTVSFALTNTNLGLFSSQPQIDSQTGDLSYTLIANAFGSATVTVVLSDDGGTADGGVDRITQTFTLTVEPINDAPGFAIDSTNLTILEDQGATYSAWAKSLTQGAFNETDQSLSFFMSTSCPECFSSEPVIYTATGDLCYTLAADHNENITVWATLVDSGGTANGGVDRITQTFLINVLSVNDPPGFTIVQNLEVLEDSAGTYTSWASALTQGAFNETDQQFSYSITTSCPECFIAEPFIYTASGNLTYTLAADFFGEITVWVALMDDGGTANGGVDTVTHSFSITVTNINDPPGFTPGGNLTVDEDSVCTSSGWASGITPGNSYETSQTVSFALTNTNPDLFSSQPQIDSQTGDLSYTLTANEFGSTTVTVVLSDDGGTADGGVDRITNTFTITVLSVNDPPGVTIGSGHTVLEESAQTYTSWASALTQGAFNETDQHLSYSITTSCPECFIADPFIYTASGDLTYTLAADFFGKITVWVVLMDDGGTTNGGVDTITQSFSITVTNINDAPGFSQGSHLTVNEDAVCTSSGWASAITPGNSYETSQTVSFALTNTNPDLFSSQPQINSQTGDLSYTLTANAFGSATVTVVLSDDGGTADGGVDRITQTFTLTVEPVNDAPGFATDSTSLTILEDMGETYTAWAKSLTQGAFNETDQALSFSITTSCPECFISEPVIYTATGDLCYTLAADHNENITVWATLIDSGGTANGGVDRITQTFLINVLSVNDPPGFTIAQNLEVLEDSAGTYTSWASALTQGAFNETDQQLSYSITTSCPECFIAKPFIYTNSGNLTYTLAADIFGEITVWVALMDDGGTANGGVDTVTHSFSITVVSINDPPGYTPGGNLTVDEDSVCTSSGWATGITSGNIYEMSQTVSFALTNTNPGLFSSQPQINPLTGDLSYTLTSNAFGSATVTVVLSDDGGTASGGMDRITDTFVINVSSVNDSPGFTKGPDRYILEGDAETYTQWATDISAGPANETEQTLAFSITTSCDECFDSVPVVYTSTGDLSYTLAADSGGIVTVWVTLMDDGGTFNGGIDTMSQTFVISITDVNDPPSFTKGDDPSVLEDTSGSILAWAKNITPANKFESIQSLEFQLTCTHSALFTTPPTIDPVSGDLAYTLAANEFGSTTVTVVLIDTGGTAYNGIDRMADTFVFNVTPVNDAPNFTIGPDLMTLEAHGATYTSWANSLTPGAFNETNQKMSFSVTTSCPDCFVSQPIVYTATGDLCYTLSADHNGDITVWVALIDDGGTDDGGIDSTTHSFAISITPVNDPPGFSVGANLTVNEDSINNITSGWATEITPGNRFETDQAVHFTLTHTNLQLFSVQPAIEDSSGTLSYTLAAHEFGSTTVTVVLSDNGGTANGGIDRITETFIITVMPVNDSPTMTSLSNQTIDESSIAGPLAFTIGDIDADALTVTVSSSYTQLIPNNYIVFGNTNQSSYTHTTRLAFESIPLSITLSPFPGQTGTSTINVTVTDGIDNDNTSFDITVNGIFHNGPGGVGNTLGGSSLQLWLAADALTGYSDGDAITSWTDLSGFNHTLSQSVNCPTYTSTFSNNKPAIEFNGTNHYFDHVSALDFKEMSGLTVFAVIHADSYSSNQSIIARDSDSHHGWACQLNNNKLLFSIAASASESITISGTNDVAQSQKIVSFIYDGLLDKFLAVYDGNTDDSESANYTSPAKIQASGADLRVGNDGNGNFFKGRIAEIIVYNRFLSTAEHVLVNNYLSSKYDIPLAEKDRYDGDTDHFDQDVVGIGQESDGSNKIAISAGLLITNTNFLQDDGDYLLLGHNRESNGITSVNLPPDVNTSWERVWMVHKTDINSNGGDIQLTFDLEMADMAAITPSTDFVLLKRSGPSGAFTIFDENVSFMGKQLQFTVDTANLNTDDCLTLGSTINYALKFNGLDQSAISESSIALTNTSFTIEYWAKRNVTGEMYVLGQGPQIWEADKNLNMGFSSTDTIIFGFDDINTVETSSAYTDSQWHHYAFTYNDGTRAAEIYIDGELSTTSVMSDGYSGTGQLFIGEAPGNLNRYQGELDDIRIWNTDKSASELFSDRNKNLQGNEANLIYYWQLNQGIGAIAFEKTALVNNLELSITTASPEWVVSSLPMGYSATGQIETLGVNNFPGTGVVMDYNYHHNAEVYVTKISTEANLLPNADTVFSKQYWVISRSDETSFDADITFTCDDDITGSNAKLAKLFWRENGSPGSWTPIAYGASIDAGSDTIGFNGIKRTGQFMLANENFAAIPASGKALKFDGTDDWAIDETNRIAIDNTAFTIEFWAKRGSIDSSQMAIGHTNYTNGLNIGFNADNTFQFSFDTNQATTLPYTDLNWHHWAVSFDSSNYTQTVYCDGILITNHVAGDAYQLTGHFYIGCGSDQSFPFNGLLDDIRIWTSVRSQSDIQDNMYVPLNGNETDLMAYYRIDEPWSYTYLTDAAANSVNLEITGSMQQSDWVDSHAWSNRVTDEDINFTLSAGYDLEGDALAIASNSAPISGSFSRNNTEKTVIYDPNNNINGQDWFSFTVAASTPIYPITMTILPINDPPVIGFIDTQEVAANAVADNISFTISDPESFPYSLSILPESSDTSIVPNNNIFVDCVSGDCTASITPNTNMTGSLSITLTVSDPEGLTATSVFGLTVNALPEISHISDYSSTANTSLSISFNVTDIESTNGDLSLSLTTSDPNILPITQTKLMNSNGNCTISLTPTLFSQGTVHIDIVVFDTHGYSTTTGFNVTIISMAGSGYMMNFDGSYSAKSNQNLSFSNHSVEAWIKTNQNDWGGIVSTDNNTGKWSEMLIAPSGVLSVHMLNAGGHEKAYSGTTVINDSNWHHVAYTYDATMDTLNLYVDGVKEITSASENQPFTNFSLNEKIHIGVDNTESSHFSGSLDEIRIWDAVRSIEDFQDNMCQKVEPAASNLIAYYRFDQINDNKLIDMTANNNDCQLNGGGSWAVSEAPIGDESVNNYTGLSLALAHSDGDRMTLTISSGSPDGIHLYIVNEFPNTFTVDLGTVQADRYWGAFVSGSFDTLDFYYEYQLNPYASLIAGENSVAFRNDNSDSWVKKGGSEDSGSGVLEALGVFGRGEVILRGE